MPEGEILTHAESLPPRDAWLIDPTDPEQRIDTPIDEYGFIDTLGLLQAVKASIDPSYVWNKQTRDHHLYWPEHNYPFIPGVPRGYNPRLFRELPIHIVRIPLQFERWLHHATNEPEIPDPEMMRVRIDAFQRARLIYKKAHQTVQEERRLHKRRRQVATDPNISEFVIDGVDVQSESYFNTTVNMAFDALLQHLEDYERIPKEHQLFDPNAPPQDIATKLGRFVKPRAQNYSLLVAA